MTDAFAFEGPVRVVGLPGSLRETSHTRSAVRLALRGAAEHGAETELIDLRDYHLPLCHGGDEYPADVDRLRETVVSAHGLILGTPEYHGSYSGVLKNALDLMGFDEFEDKIVGLVAVSGGAMGGLSAMIALREVGRALHAWVTPHQAAIPRAWKAFDDDGALKDEAMAERVLRVGREVARFARLHESEDALAFLQEWTRAPENPGGKHA